MLPQLAPLFPPQFTGYHEPFVGSAAVYFHLHGLWGRLGRVRLTDSNAELINCYRMIRDQVDAAISLLARHKKKHSRDYYYAVRAQTPNELDEVQRAARFIYLNKTCYNGLYRVNRSGQFNVPMGRYKNPGIFDPDGLRRASAALQGAEIEAANFRDALGHAKRGDFVYFDPPYHPLTKTANFTAYTDSAFGEQEQRELAQVYCELDRTGCQVMLSNSWTPFVRKLYEGFNLIEVKANRAINSNAGRRGRVSEMVVLNYEP